MNQVYRNNPGYGPLTELCYVSRDIEQTILGWVNLVGAGPFFIHEVTLDYECQGEKSEVPVVTALGASGSMIIEIIQPKAGTPSIFGDALNGKGDCLQALKYNVRDFSTETEKLKTTGHELAATIHHWDGGRSDFFGGIKAAPFLVKAAKPGSSFDGIAEALVEVHRNWNGKAPIRHLSRLHPLLSFSCAAAGLMGT